MFVALTSSACSEAAEKAAAEGEEKEEEGAEGQEKKDEGKSFMMLQGPEGQPSLTILLDEAAGRMDITQLPAEDYVVCKVFTARTKCWLALAPASRFDDKWQLLQKDKMLHILVDEAVLAIWEAEALDGPRPSGYVEGKGPLIKYLVSFFFNAQPFFCADIFTAQISTSPDGSTITSTIELEVEGMTSLDWCAFAQTTPQARGAP